MTMTKRAFSIAILNIFAVLNLPLLAQQTPSNITSTPTAKGQQFSILQQIGEPPVRVAKGAEPVPTTNEPKPGTQSILAGNDGGPKVDQLQKRKRRASSKPPIIRAAKEPKPTKKFNVTFDGPDHIEPGQVQVFNFNVTNLQQARSTPVVMQLETPTGIQFIDSTIRGRVDLQRRTTEWTVPALHPGETVNVSFRARGIHSGPQQQRLSVIQNSERIQNLALDSFVLQQQSVRTRILANNNSVTVGHPSQIEVALTNLTREIQRGVEVQVELPRGVEVVKSVLYDVENSIVKFQPIDINGNQTLRVSLTVVAREEGDSQMSAVVVSETQPISNKENAMLRISRVASASGENFIQQR